MAIREATVQNNAGIHCRPSAVIIREFENYPGAICVTSQVDGEEYSADLTSIVGLLALGLQKGAVIQIAVEGDDDEAVADKVKELFEFHFDFPPRDSTPDGDDL